MKVCLIFPPACINPDLIARHIPLGIYILGTLLERSGMAVVLLDQLEFLHYIRNRRKFTKNVFSEDPSFQEAVGDADILGLSCDSFNYGVARLMIESAKEINKEIKVMLGGLHPTLLDEYVIKTSGADVVLRGEGEERIIDLIACLRENKSLSEIAGLTYIDSKGETVRNVDAPPCPVNRLSNFNRVDYRLISHWDKQLMLPVETSRGCLFRCKFCSVFYRGQRRLLPIEEVISNIKRVNEFSEDILFTDDCFTSELHRAKAILSYVENSDKNVLLNFEARASDLAVEGSSILEAINRNKIRGIQIGVECGYSEGLKKIKKGITLSQVDRSCRLVKDLGLAEKTLISFIIGFPWEGAKECVRTIEFAGKIRLKYGVKVMINWWIPAPSELWWEVRDRFGVDESMYDDLSWPLSDDLFFRTHPSINFKEKQKISFLKREASGLSDIW